VSKENKEVKKTALINYLTAHIQSDWSSCCLTALLSSGVTVVHPRKGVWQLLAQLTNLTGLEPSSSSSTATGPLNPL
jgi:hypothetical protein